MAPGRGGGVDGSVSGYRLRWGRHCKGVGDKVVRPIHACIPSLYEHPETPCTSFLRGVLHRHNVCHGGHLGTGDVSGHPLPRVPLTYQLHRQPGLLPSLNPITLSWSTFLIRARIHLWPALRN